jgi:hypothetical protein
MEHFKYNKFMMDRSKIECSMVKDYICFIQEKSKIVGHMKVISLKEKDKEMEFRRLIKILFIKESLKMTTSMVKVFSVNLKKEKKLKKVSNQLFKNGDMKVSSLTVKKKMKKVSIYLNIILMKDNS